MKIIITFSNRSEIEFKKATSYHINTDKTMFVVNVDEDRHYYPAVNVHEFSVIGGNKDDGT